MAAWPTKELAGNRAYIKQKGTVHGHRAAVKRRQKRATCYGPCFAALRHAARARRRRRSLLLSQRSLLRCSLLRPAAAAHFCRRTSSTCAEILSGPLVRVSLPPGPTAATSA